MVRKCQPKELAEDRYLQSRPFPLPPKKSIPQPTEEVNPDLGIQEIGTPAADSYVPLETAQEPVAAAAPSVAALPTEIFPAATAEPPIPTATTEPPVSTETLPAVSENANPILGIQPTSETIPRAGGPHSRRREKTRRRLVPGLPLSRGLCWFSEEFAR